MRKVVLVLAGLVCLSAVIHAEPVSVLFDEAHNEMNTISEARARQIDSTYPEFYYFGSLAEEVSTDFNLTRGVTSFDQSYLEGFDVVILSTPRSAFQQQELDALKRYVENGGGLLVLQNAGPSATTGSNQVAQLFGISFRPGVLVSRSGDWDAESFEVDEVDSRHPIMLSCDGLQMNWGCSIAESAECDVLLASRADTWQDTNGNLIADAGEPAGPLAVAVAFEAGTGRVVLVGDNAFHNNLWSLNRTFLLSALRWLSAGAGTTGALAGNDFVIQPGISRESVEEVGDGQQHVSEEVHFYPNSKLILPGETIYWTLDLGDLEGPFTIAPELNNDNDPEPWIQTTERLLVVPFTYAVANLYVPFVTVIDGTGETRKIYSSEVVSVVPELTQRASLELDLPTPADPAGDYIKAMNVASFDHTLFGSESGEAFIKGELDRLSAMGCNMLFFTVLWFIDDVTSIVHEPIYGDAWPACWSGTYPVDALVKLADWSHERGMRVCLRYGMWMKGDHSGTEKVVYAPSDPAAYLRNQTEQKVAYAGLCEALGIELLCLETENKFFTRLEGVSDLIRSVRDVYSGLLTNGAYSVLDNLGCPYADELDLLAWSDYYFFHHKPDIGTTAGQLTDRMLFHYADEIRYVLSRFGKVGIFTEIGVDIKDASDSDITRQYIGYLDALSELQEQGARLCGSAWYAWDLTDQVFDNYVIEDQLGEDFLSSYFRDDLSDEYEVTFEEPGDTDPSVDLLLEDYETGRPPLEYMWQGADVTTDVLDGSPLGNHCLRFTLAPVGSPDYRVGYAWSRSPLPLDWSQYSSFNLWLRSADENWFIEISFRDVDGDIVAFRFGVWPSLGSDVPETRGWHLVTLSLRLFARPSWHKAGDGNMDWSQVTSWGLGIFWADRSMQTMWIDHVYLSREGDLY
jgi:hypothetical protein